MIRLISILLCATSLSAAAADAKWHFNLPEAQALAKKEKKLVFINFTGSDWCGWCMKLKAEVFTSAEFTTYARTNLVLVEIDLPQNKPISPEQLNTNLELKQKYRAEGFPTIIVLSDEGQELWRLGGYAQAPAAEWVKALETMKKMAAAKAGKSVQGSKGS